MYTVLYVFIYKKSKHASNTIDNTLIHPLQRKTCATSTCNQSVPLFILLIYTCTFNFTVHIKKCQIHRFSWEHIHKRLITKKEYRRMWSTFHPVTPLDMEKTAWGKRRSFLLAVWSLSCHTMSVATQRNRVKQRIRCVFVVCLFFPPQLWPLLTMKKDGTIITVYATINAFYIQKLLLSEE